MSTEIKVKIIQTDTVVELVFTADIGKFGTSEILDEYTLTAKALLGILQEAFLEDDH